MAKYPTLEELRRLIDEGKVTPTELVEESLKRIAESQGSVGAFAYVASREAREEARRQTAVLRGGKRPDGAVLFGIPVAVKDLENVRGMPTTYGAQLFKDNIAKEDDAGVARLRAAGAIFVGKTTTPIFGSKALAKNKPDGLTRNPWDLRRTAGGSSSGAGAAVALGAVPVATGSDAGGSIRIPASFCGCFGFKPTFGVIPQPPSSFGIQKFTNLTHLGPLSRGVMDAAIYLDVTAGYHPSDPASLPRPSYSYRDAVEGYTRGSKLRIGFTLDTGYMAGVVDPGVREVFLSAVSQLHNALGCPPPVHLSTLGLPDLGAEWPPFAASQNFIEMDSHPTIKGHEGGLEKTFVQNYRRAGAAFGVELMGTVARKKFEINRKLSELFKEFDLLLTPTMPHTAWAAQGPLPTKDLYSMHSVGYSYPFNFSGHPACTLRAGLHQDGLPVGIQIVGERHEDVTVLAAARAFESHTKCHDEWPRVPQAKL
eukprot:Hpha_TRINITY_DN34286_c0_g1::TRINITY_DN34286_c0_g1_i1::g.34397::m.34397/K02433/gatA, QRSL1; aspartyl-tRNA(Asn)/glutamyl-tRNA(Gln) amidotransferase subunit A